MALHRRPEKGLLAGMYEFPMVSGHRSSEEVIDFLERKGLKILRILPLKEARHIFTHKEWDMWGYMIRVDELAPRGETAAKENWIFADPAETEKSYPIPSAFAAYTEYLRIKLGNRKYQ